MNRLCFLLVLIVISVYCYDRKYWRLLNSAFIIDKYIYWFNVLKSIYYIYVPSTTVKLKTRSLNDCPCSSPTFCDRIASDMNKEIFTFSLKCNQSVWSKYDWNRITTIAVSLSDYDPELMCYAHEKGARIVLLDSMSVQNITNQKLRKDWIHKKIKTVRDLFLDGINLDFEDPVENASEEQEALTAWVEETREKFSKYLPGSQVTFDIAWAPNCIDKRCYDVKKIAEKVDFLFIMSYDEQSQIFGDCVAKGNSPFFQTISGIHKFLELRIPPEKLVLGLPWYGYRYQCISITKDNVCSIAKVPFRDVNCSDAAGIQIPLGEIQQILKNSTTGRLWNETELSPYFNYKIDDDIYQIRYDDSESLYLKYKFAEIFNLRGVGMWNAVQLDYRNTKEAEKERKAIWNAMPRYNRYS